MAELIVPWPKPATLEGVKSKKKAIFEVSAGELAVGTEVSHVVNVKVSLDSRVAAIGDEARALAVETLAGGGALVSGDAVRPSSLVVVHLGPYLAGLEATLQAHLAAIAVALKRKPQVVVLEEALAMGNEAWIKAFDIVLASEALASFAGAVVVCSDELSFVLRHACTQCWVANRGELSQQAIVGPNLSMIDDAVAVAAASRALADEAPKARRRVLEAVADADEALLQEVRDLSEFCFEEDDVEKARKGGWTLALLVENSGDGGARSMRGFVCYKIIPGARAELHLHRAAVPMYSRKRGFARLMMNWLITKAARMPRSQCAVITLDSVKKAIPFYERFGFVIEATNGPQTREEVDEEDQLTWMERPNVSVVSEPVVQVNLKECAR